MTGKRILLLEDDTMIAKGLLFALEQEGYQVFHFGTVQEAKSALEKENFDLALLDMQLPDGSGIDVQTVLRSRDTSVLFLTVMDEESHVVQAFETGAEDYIVKPFRIRELLARINRVFSRKEEEKQIIQLGQVQMDLDAGKVFLAGEQVELTALECKLLQVFATNKGRILTRSQILDTLWDITGNFVEDNTLTVYVKRLRRKLGEAVTIETVRGLGYRVD